MAPNGETVAPKADLAPAVGPIFLPRNKKSGRKESKPGQDGPHGCPMGFVRPDLPSRCTWRKEGPR